VFSGLALLVFGVLSIRSGSPATAESADVARIRKLIGRTMLIGLLICVAMIFCYRARFKDRWMQQLLFVTPVYLVLFCRQRFSTERWRWLLRFNGLIAISILVVLPIALRLDMVSGEGHQFSRPYGAIAAQIKDHGFERGVICVPNRKLAGNLKLQFKDSKVIESEYAWFSAQPDVAWLAAWEIYLDQETQVNPTVVDLVSKLRGENLSGAELLMAQAVSRTTGETNRFGFVILPPQPKTKSLPN
jgi:hypothetical protein